MVSPITSSPGSSHAHSPMKAKAQTSPAETAPGKSGDAVGHRAKMAISGAGEASDLPKNIQGKVASALARGLSIEALLSIQDSADIADTAQDQEPLAEPAAAPADVEQPPSEPVDLLADPVEPLPDPVEFTDLSDGDTAPEPDAAQPEQEPELAPEQAADTTDSPA